MYTYKESKNIIVKSQSKASLKYVYSKLTVHTKQVVTIRFVYQYNVCVCKCVMYTFGQQQHVCATVCVAHMETFQQSLSFNINTQYCLELNNVQTTTAL